MYQWTLVSESGTLVSVSMDTGQCLNGHGSVSQWTWVSVSMDTGQCLNGHWSVSLDTGQCLNGHWSVSLDTGQYLNGHWSVSQWTLVRSVIQIDIGACVTLASAAKCNTTHYFKGILCKRYIRLRCTISKHGNFP